MILKEELKKIKDLEAEIERLESIRCSLLGQFQSCNDHHEEDAINNEINDIDLIIEDIKCSIVDIYADMELEALEKKELRGK